MYTIDNAAPTLAEQFAEHHYRPDYSYVTLYGHEHYYDPDRHEGPRAIVGRIFAIPMAKTEDFLADLKKIKTDAHGIYPQSKMIKKATEIPSKKNVMGVVSAHDGFLSDFFDPLTGDNIPAVTYRDYYGNVFLTERRNNQGKPSNGPYGEPQRVLKDAKTGRALQVEYRNQVNNISKAANGPLGLSKLVFDTNSGEIVQAKAVSPIGNEYAQSASYLKQINRKSTLNIKMSAEEAETLETLRDFVKQRNGLTLRVPQHFYDPVKYINHQAPRAERNIKRKIG